MTAAEIRAEVHDTELAWRPDFQMSGDAAFSDEDSFTVWLQTLARCATEAESLL